MSGILKTLISGLAASAYALDQPAFGSHGPRRSDVTKKPVSGFPHTAAGYNNSNGRCRCRPSDPCWPGASQWASLKKQVKGNLIELKPIASACRAATYDAELCGDQTQHWNESKWRSDQPEALQWENLEAWIEKGETCYLSAGKNAPCKQGRISPYSIQAKSVGDIQAGVRFASKHNLKLAIRNTGHCYLGRSSAPDSLQISTHALTDMKFVESFPTPEARAKGGQGVAAITMGAGCQLAELYKFAGEKGVVFSGGSSRTVGAAGGYIQGGGHSILGQLFGMATDNVLQFKIVTADGKHVTANELNNPDLFWALRGGGGGTWGVVTEVTVKAFKDPPIVKFSLTGGAPPVSNAFWKIFEAWHRFLPKYSDAGGTGYYYLTPNTSLAGTSYPVSTFVLSGGFAGETSTEKVDKIMKPFVAEINKFVSKPFKYRSFFIKTATQSYIGPLSTQADATGSSGGIGSRIISYDFLKTPGNAAKMTKAIRKLRVDPEAFLTGNVVGGGKVRQNAHIDSALHPVWRKAVVEFLVARVWTAATPIEDILAIQKGITMQDVPTLKSLEPGAGGGTYLNEADVNEENFQDSFWGVNYPRLAQIKRKYDPDDLFISNKGVGSERWDKQGLCRI